MLTCPKCGNPLDARAKFCSACGAPVPVEASAEHAPAPANIVPEMSDAEAYVAALPDTKEKLRPSRRTLLFGGVGLVCVALVALLAVLLANRGSDEQNYALYLKNDEIFYTDFSKDSAFQISQVLGKSYDGDFSDISYLLGDYCYMTKDGKLLFYPEQIAGSDIGVTLCYRQVQNEKEEPVKVDSDVRYYAVNDKATLVTYMKGSEGALYQYDIKKGEKSKIYNAITTFEVSPDGQKIYFSDKENSLYFWTSGKDPQKLSGNVTENFQVCDDFAAVYYNENGSLYKKAEGKEAEKLASNVSKILLTYDTGEVYYLKAKSDASGSLLDFVQDDMKDIDATMTEPQMPTMPRYFDYPSTEAYRAAFEQYKSDYKQYWQAKEDYWTKSVRDNLRNGLAEVQLPESQCTLCFFDGKQEKVVSESFVYSEYEQLQYYDCSENTPVLVFRSLDAQKMPSIKLSEVDSIYDAQEAISDGLEEAQQFVLAVGATATELQTSQTTGFTLTADGKTLYYVDNLKQGELSGELYKVSISGTVPGEPELYDSDVYAYDFYDFGGKPLYYKNFSDDKCDMYLDKEIIDYDVSYRNMAVDAENGKILYLCDWSYDDPVGTLKLFNGKAPEKIADDVYTYTLMPNGNVLYLCNYDTVYKKGELHLYKNGESEKLEDDVQEIIYCYQNRYSPALKGH